jgi:hypothetical protein
MQGWFVDVCGLFGFGLGFCFGLVRVLFIFIGVLSGLLFRVDLYIVSLGVAYGLFGVGLGMI